MGKDWRCRSNDGATIDAVIEADDKPVILSNVEEIDSISFTIVRRNVIDDTVETTELRTLFKYIHEHDRPELILPRLTSKHHYYADCVLH